MVGGINSCCTRELATMWDYSCRSSCPPRAPMSTSSWIWKFACEFMTYLFCLVHLFCLVFLLFVFTFNILLILLILPILTRCGRWALRLRVLRECMHQVSREVPDACTRNTWKCMNCNKFTNTKKHKIQNKQNKLCSCRKLESGNSAWWSLPCPHTGRWSLPVAVQFCHTIDLLQQKVDK